MSAGRVIVYNYTLQIFKYREKRTKIDLKDLKEVVEVGHLSTIVDILITIVYA